MFSITLAVWLLLFVTFSVLSLTRSSWGICLYMLTYYVTPYWWWWGKGLLQFGLLPFNLIAALIFAAAVFLDARRHPTDRHWATARVGLTLLFYGINAIVVHYLFASNVEKSFEMLELLWKQMGLFLLLLLSLRDEFDFKVFLYAILGGALYLGYEIVLNERGHFEDGRLTLPLYNIGDENYLAGLLCLAIPLGGYFLLLGNRYEKVFAVLSLPLILDTIIRCNSRGAFLALLMGAACLLIRARGKARRYALIGCALGGVAAFALLGDPEIVDRFLSTFDPAAERDSSAQSRLDYWRLGGEMIMDYPLGSGGEAAFKSDLGLKYVRKVGLFKYRAVHNGYIDIAAGWGVQGFLLYASVIFFAWRRLRVGVVDARLHDDAKHSFLGVCIEAALVTQLVAAMFISSLDGEYFFWWIAMALAYGRIFYPINDETVEDDLEAGDEWEDEDYDEEMGEVEEPQPVTA